MSNKEWMYLIFGAVSLLLLAVSTVRAIQKYAKRDVVMAPQHIGLVYTTFVFIGTVLVFYPMHLQDTALWGDDGYHVFRSLLVAVHSTMRNFVLDGDFSTVTAAMAGVAPALRVGYTLYCAVLYVVAPVMTLSAVLSLLGKALAELRFRMCNRGRTLYIMSALNERAIALAKDINRRWHEEREKEEELGHKKPFFVFADVYEQNVERIYELVDETKHIKTAVCFKKDVTQIYFLDKKCDVEIFFINENETENVRGASIITEQLERANCKFNVKLFVVSYRESSSYTIDSLKYDNLLTHANDHNYGKGTFKIRRVNHLRQLVWNEVPKMNLMARAKDGVISVMLVGMGAYGLEFLKMLSWYCQLDGYKLELNLFDKRAGSENHGGIESVIARYCPDLLAYGNGAGEEGGALYDIACYDNVDFLSGKFADMMTKGEHAGRLSRTSVVIVALGDDDTNIETSVYLRMLFDRARGVVAQAPVPGEVQKREDPAIYSVVYDSKKSGAVRGEGHDFLVDHRGVPFHIHFIGSIDSQFSYAGVCDEGLEGKSRRSHSRWSRSAAQICDELRAKGHTQEEIDELRKGDLYHYEDNEERQKEESKKYNRFEYYRISSLARLMHEKMRDASPHAGDYVCTENPTEPRMLCTCENCIRRKKLEHARWVAYMRANGYVRGDVTASRAKQHCDMRNWDRLNVWEQAKD